MELGIYVHGEWGGAREVKLVFVFCVDLWVELGIYVHGEWGGAREAGD